MCRIYLRFIHLTYFGLDFFQYLVTRLYTHFCPFQPNSSPRTYAHLSIHDPLSSVLVPLMDPGYFIGDVTGHMNNLKPKSSGGK